MKYLLSLALLAVVSARPELAAAQGGASAADRATARRLATEGQIALKKGDFDTAADRFERANDLLSAPTFLVRLARARVGQGRLVEAYEIYRKIIRDGVDPNNEAFKRALAEAKQEVKGVEPRLAWVTVNLIGANPDDVEVSLNGVAIPSAALGAQRPVDPGKLQVRATGEGYRDTEVEVQLAESEHLPPIELRMIAVPKPPPVALGPADGPEMPDGREPSFMSQSTLGYLTLALGGAGLAVGGVTGILAYNRHEDLLNIPCAQLDGDRCYVLEPTSDKQDAAANTEREMEKFATASTIGFAAGGALAATGLILLLTAPEDPTESSQASIRPFVGLGGIGAVGTF